MRYPVVSLRRGSLLLILLAAATLLWDRPLSADSFDWRNVNGQNWLTSVKNQGSAGTCWDFAGCGILEAKYMLTRNDTTYQPDVSEQQLCCAGVGSISGGNACDVDDYAVSTGVVPEAELPYTQQNTSPLWPLPSGWQNNVFKATSDDITIAQGTDINTVKNCLKEFGPLTIRCVVPGDWYNLQDGSGTGNHEVVIVGYHDNVGSENAPGGGYWIVKNSWGSSWNGDGNGNGYGEIAYASEPNFYTPPWYYFGLDDNHNVTGLNGLVYFTGAMAMVTWKGGSGTWSRGGNYWSGVDMYGNSLSSYTWDNSEASATFNASSGTSITISGPVVAHGVTISSGATGYVFSGASGGALTVTSSGITAHENVTFNVPVSIGAPQTWTIDSGKSLVIGGNLHTIVSPLTLNSNGDTTITGSIDGGGVLNSMGDAPGAITMNGAGTLHLTGAATYSVPLTLSSGYLSFEQDGSNVANYTSTISGGGNGWVSKSGTGTIILSGANTYNCWTRLYNGVVQADVGVGLPSQSSLILNGGVFQSNSTTTYTDTFRNEVSGTNRWLSWWDGGFAGGAGTLTVNLRGNGSAVDWTGNGDTGIGNSMKFGSPTAQNPVIFQNALNLDGTVRAIYVDNDSNNANNYAIMSGVISNGAGGSASGLVKNGPGLLILTAVNTYGDGAGYDVGATQINQGALQADWGVGYSSNSGLILNGGVLQSNSAVTFTNKFWYDGWNDSVTWYSGGFSAGGGKMTVNLYGDGRAINWGTDPRGGIVGTMILSSASAQYETEVQNALNLNGGVRTIQVDDNPNSTGDFATISGVIADGSASGGIAKTGAGTLYLTGVNTFTGGITISGGTLVLRDQTNAAFLANPIANSATLEFNTLNSNMTYTGVITGAGGVNKTGPGQLTLTGASTYGDPTGYSAYTTVNQGILQADRGAGLPINSGLILNGGVFQSNSAVTFTDPFWMWAPTGKELIWNSGGFAAGGGKMTVNLFGDGRTITWGTNGYQGIAGTMILNSTSAQYETEIQNGIDLAGGTRTIEVDDNPNSTGDFATLSGVISDSVGGASLTKTGAGTLVLGGTSGNTFTGAFNMTEGNLSLAKTSGAAIAGTLNLSAPYGATFTTVQGNGQFSSSAVINFNGGYWPHFELLGNAVTVAGISDAYATGVIENSQSETGISANGTMTVNNSTNANYSGYIRDGNFGGSTGKLVFVKGSTGTLTLSGSNCGGYTGGLTVNAGTLDYSGSVLPACRYTLNGGTLIIGTLSQSIGAFALAGGTLTGSGTLTSNATYNIQSGAVNAVLAGSVGLSKTTTGTATINAPTYTGVTSVSAGTLNFTGALPGGVYAISGGMLNINALSKSISSFQISGGTVTGSGTLTSNSAYNIQTGTVNSTLAGSVALNKTGVVTAILNGANTYSGSTTISAGTLQIGSGGTTGSIASPAVTVASGATLYFDRSDAYGYTGAITGSGTVKIPNAGTNFGTGYNASLTAFDGTTVLSGANVRLNLRSATGLGTGTIDLASQTSVWMYDNAWTIPANFILRGPGTSYTSNRTMATIGGDWGAAGNTTFTGQFTLYNDPSYGPATLAPFQGGNSYTLSGPITGSGGIQIGLGTNEAYQDGSVYFAGSSANTYSGDTNVYNYLYLQKTGGVTAIGSIGNVNIYGVDTATGGLIDLGGNNEINPAATLNVIGGATWAFLRVNGHQQTLIALNGAGANSYIRNTDAGTSAGTVGNGVLTINGSANSAYSGRLYDWDSGTDGKDLLALVKDGSGTLTLSGSYITYTGGTTLKNGVLDISAATNFAYSTINSAHCGPLVLQGGTLSMGSTNSQTASGVQLAGGAITGSVTLTSQSAFDIQSGSVSVALAGGVGLNKTTTGVATISAAPTYTGATSVSAGTLNFTAGLPGGDYTISGGTLNINGLPRSIGTLQISGGSLIGAGTLTSNAAYDVRGGTVGVDLAGISIGLTKSGLTTALLTGPDSYTGRTTVTGGALELGLSAENCVLNLGGADIQSGKIIFDYAGGADPAATIQSLLKTSYDGGRWDVGQFRDSTAATTGLTLGCVDNTSSKQVTVMATYPGDFNLDGVVDNLDRSIWAANVFTGTTWQQGDANYDGVVNGLDRDLWFSHLGLPPLAAASPAAGVTPAPEPATLALLAASVVGLLAYACRKRKR
jgi:autotransporter-associated beta strand protein